MKTPFQEYSVYHIYNRANGDENLFRESKNYEFFLKKYFYHIYPIAETYAFCLMPNHFHAMVRIRGVDDVKDLTGFKNLSGLVSLQFSKFFNSYAKAYNKLYARRGSLFQRPFKHKEVLNQAYFHRLILYIHQNPVKHGFVNDPFDWPYSSLHYHAGRQQEQLPIGPDILESSHSEVIRWFGGNEGFNNLHHVMKIERSVFD